MRDFLVTGVIFALLPACFFSPWIGVLVWSWIGYMNPHRLTWSFAYTMPFAQMVAIATLSGLLFTKDRMPLPRRREVYLLLTLWGVFLASTFNALHPDPAWEQLTKVSKILLMTFVTLLLFQDRRKLRVLFYVIALSIGFFGLKGGIWAVATGGANSVLGPPGSFIEGNTDLGLALNMVLPILLLLSRDERRPWLRYLLRATFGFSIIAVLFTYSRGAVLGLAVVLPLMLLKSRIRLAIIPLALVAVLFGKPLIESVMPAPWLERMGTIGTPEEDASASMRLNAWRVAYLLALDHPLLGAGFRPFSPEVYLRYSPDERWNDNQDAHSIYLQVLAEHGFTGLALYGGLILSTLASLRQIVRRSRRDPGERWLGDAARTLEVSLAGFLVSGAFLSISYFDLFFHVIAMTTILRLLLDQQMAEPSRGTVPTAVRQDLVRR